MTTKRNTTKNLRTNKIIKTTSIIVSVILGIIFGIYQFMPQIKNALSSESAKKEAQQTTDDSSPDTQKRFNIGDVKDSSVSVITSSNSNVAVNSNNVANSNNVTNSNNKLNQKIENNFREGSKTINNYSSSITQQPNYKPQFLSKSNQTPNTQQQPPSVTRSSSPEDRNIKNYFAMIENHRNRGVDMAKCNSVQVCLELYDNWQNQANNLLTEIDNYLQQKYQKRSELQQQFGNEIFDTRIFPDTKSSLESIQGIFFNRADVFGMMNFSLKNSLNPL